MRTEPSRSSPSLPLAYFAARNGTLVRVIVQTRDELRLLRTELALLRRIRRCVSTERLLLRRPGSIRPMPEKYSAEDRRELAAILSDAFRPIVDETITLLDGEFEDLRKEVMMSVVNEEAEKIALEAAESTVIDAGTGESAPETPSAVEAALADAERELAAVADVILSPAPGSDAEPEPQETQDGAEAAAPVVAPDAASDTNAAAAPDTVEPTTDVAACAPADDAAQHEPTPSETAKDEPVPETPPLEPVAGGTEGGPADKPAENEAYTPARAERVMAEIENGIRKLADLLRNEVNDRWAGAKEALENTISARESTDETCQQARTLADEITKLTKEARSARDEAVTTSREARSFREDARRAKERADTSAATAELAADQATRELETIRATMEPKTE